MISKFGREFEDVSKLFDHTVRNGSDCLNSHYFVSLMLCVPVWSNRWIAYLAVPLGCHVRQKKRSKLELTVAIVHQVMPSFTSQRNVIILCDGWYAKENLTRIADERPNLDLICDTRTDPVTYDLAPQPTGRRGRPAEYGERLSIKEDFTPSAEKAGDYYMDARRAPTSIFGQRKAFVYVTPTERTGGSRHLFFSTVFPEQMQMFCAQQEKVPLNQTGSERVQLTPSLCCTFRWDIEVSYYEQKTFWPLCSYMLHSRRGIEMLVNPIDTSYCAMKVPLYREELFSEYRIESMQEFRFAPSEQIRQRVFHTTSVRDIKINIKSNAAMKALKQLIR